MFGQKNLPFLFPIRFYFFISLMAQNRPVNMKKSLIDYVINGTKNALNKAKKPVAVGVTLASLLFPSFSNAQSNDDRVTPAETLGNPYVRPDIYKIEGKDSSYVLPSNISDWLNSNRTQRENELEEKLQIAKEWRQNAENYDPNYQYFRFIEAEELQKYFFGISNIDGYMEYREDYGLFPVTKEHNAEINKPLYWFLYTNKNTGSVDVVVGAFTNKNGDVFNIDDYTFYDPVNYDKLSSQDLIDKVHPETESISMGLTAYTSFNGDVQKIFGYFENFPRFKIENGEQNGIITMTPCLLTQNPVNSHVKVNANDSSVVYHNGETDINNPKSEEEILNEVNMNVETNIDTTDTFYYIDGKEGGLRNEFFGTKKIQKGKKLEILVQVGSDPRNYDALVVSEAKGQYIGDMKNIGFPNGLPEPYVHDFFNPKNSKLKDSTWVKFRYEANLTLEPLEDILVNYKKNIDTTPESLEAMGYNAIPEATSTEPGYPINYEYKQSEPEPLSEEHPEIEYQIETTYYATQELPSETLKDSTKYKIRVEDLTPLSVEAPKDTIIPKETKLKPENTGYPIIEEDNSGISPKDTTYSYVYEPSLSDSTKRVYTNYITVTDWKDRQTKVTQKVTRNLVTSIRDAENNVSKEFSMSNNYPNPFNPTTTIKFTIPLEANSETSNTTLKVYDTIGREVKILLSESLAPGEYEIKFDGSDLPSGTYFYRLTSGSHTQTHKMMLLK